MIKQLPYRMTMLLLLLSIGGFSCSKTDSGTDTTTTPPVVVPPVQNTISDVNAWLTTADRSALLKKETAVLSFGTTANSYPTINIDSTQTFQELDGFGYTVTQGSAYVINQMTPFQRTTLLNELFGNLDNSIGLSYLRIGIGATDLSSTVFSYDDMPTGQTDPLLANFSIAADNGVISLLKEILLINPSIRIMAVPWSAPVWMKDNGSTIGGSLTPAYYDVYAKYFVKYIQAMQAEGITIHAVTPQNEPLNPNNNPSLSMTAAQQTNFIKNNLGPAFMTAGISTKIVTYDHNCDRPDYPIAVLNDGAANAFVDGSAFHLYAGDISALTEVHNAFPSKSIYFTEQYTASTGNFGADLAWHLKNVIIGSMRNWSRIALEWNLANDPSFGPHTPGGCTTCLGALTINSSGGTSRNVGYYIVAHASKFVPAGSVRILSDNSGSLQTVAFLRPDGKKALIVLNEGSTAQSFNLKFKTKWVTAFIPGGAVATYTW
ncbi:MAG: glycoside hydrolase family 30 beta sandwich domain-containing protein [Ferruginibacter sp.]